MMTSTDSKLELVKKHIKDYPNFPKPGILFRDVFAVMSNPDAAAALQDLILTHCMEYKGKIQAVGALESRGFLFGPLIALKLEVPFVPIRKKGKLPGEVKEVSYSLEYGQNTFEIQCDVLPPGSSVLLVDDLLATGGSLAAGCKLIHSIGSKVNHCLVVIELKELNGKNKVPCPVYSLIQF